MDKYIKYKNKYLEFQELLGGGDIINVRKAIQIGNIHNFYEHFDTVSNKKNVNEKDQDGNTLLHIAGLSNNPNKEIVQILLTNNANANIKNNTKATPLHLAITRNANSKNNSKSTPLKIAIARDVNIKDNNKASQLQLATAHNDESINLLITKDNINIKDTFNAIPLNIAARYNNPKLILKLLETKSNIDNQEIDGTTALITALVNKYDNIAQILLEHKANVNIYTGNSPLHIAISNGNVGMLKILLEQKASVDTNVNLINIATKYNKKSVVMVNMLLDAKASVDNNALIYSIRNQDEAVIDLLLANNASVNVTANYDMSPLFTAVTSNNNRIIKKLLNYEGNINNGGVSLLNIRTLYEKQNVEIIELLLYNNADANSLDIKNNTPLHLALKTTQSKKIIKLLLNYKADCNILNNKNNSPLHIALNVNEIDQSIIDLLLENNADSNSLDYNNNTPLHIAVNQNKVDKFIVSSLLANNANVNSLNGNNNTPLHIALNLEDSDESLIELLLSNNADANMLDNNNNTPLHIALKSRNSDTIIKLLLDNKADNNSLDKKNRTPLHIALSLQAYAEKNIKMLLSKKLDANAVDINMNTLLHLALAIDNIDDNIITPLITQENIHFVNNNYETPLFSIIRKPNTANIVSKLIAAKSDVNNLARGITPLIAAINNNNSTNVQILLEHKANINLDDGKSYDSQPPLLLAINNNNIEITKILIDAKANVTTAGLIIAVRKQNEAIIDLLLANNANVNVTTNYNSSPLFIAVANNNNNIINKLLNHNADINNGDTPLLHNATKHNNEALVTQILKAGSDVYSLNNYMQIPLLDADTQNIHDLLKKECLKDYNEKEYVRRKQLEYITNYNTTNKDEIEDFIKKLNGYGIMCGEMKTAGFATTFYINNSIDGRNIVDLYILYLYKQDTTFAKHYKHAKLNITIMYDDDNPNADINIDALYQIIGICQYIKKSKPKKVMIPISINHKMKIYKNDIPGHENMFIINTESKKVTRYEPNGKSAYKMYKGYLNKIGYTIANYINKILKLDGVYSYDRLGDVTCPIDGFQRLMVKDDSYDDDSTVNEAGSCVLWSYLLLLINYKFNNIAYESLLSIVSEFIKNNNIQYTSIIRGFYHYLEYQFIKLSLAAGLLKSQFITFANFQGGDFPIIKYEKELSSYSYIIDKTLDKIYEQSQRLKSY